MCYIFQYVYDQNMIPKRMVKDKNSIHLEKIVSLSKNNVHQNI